MNVLQVIVREQAPEEQATVQSLWSAMSHTACANIPLAKSNHMAEMSIKDWGRLKNWNHNASNCQSETHILSILSTTMDEGNVDEEILLGI